MNFTLKQLQAIGHYQGNLQLIACAGSGKTEVVARRVANLLKNGCAPRNIVAFTFTDKAAAELKERIITRCREELGEMHGMAEMYVGTIHAFCLELLKNEVPKYLKYDVLNEVQQSLFIDRYSTQSGLTTSTDLTGHPLQRYRDTQHYLNALSILREADVNDQALTNCSVVAGRDNYNALLDDKRYFDYSAILDAAVYELTNTPELRDRIAERITHVIVDEYQDVNPIQEAIVWSLHELGATVCVVGDDDQTIYQWRGSDIQNILTFQNRYTHVTQVHLEENFRSSVGIVETARVFIEQNRPVPQ
jgi:DNA helicase-2/ATP-dependent DNA helicase PcrA